MTEFDSFGIPPIKAMLQKQSKKRIFGVPDLQHGYHRMPSAKDSKPRTSMSTPFGSYMWKVMPMGANNDNS